MFVLYKGQQRGGRYFLGERRLLSPTVHLGPVVDGSLWRPLPVSDRPPCRCPTKKKCAARYVDPLIFPDLTFPPPGPFPLSPLDIGSATGERQWWRRKHAQRESVGQQRRGGDEGGTRGRDDRAQGGEAGHAPQVPRDRVQAQRAGAPLRRAQRGGGGCAQSGRYAPGACVSRRAFFSFSFFFLFFWSLEADYAERSTNQRPPAVSTRWPASAEQ